MDLAAYDRRVTDPARQERAKIAAAFPERPMTRDDFEAIREAAPAELELEIGSELETTDEGYVGIIALIARDREQEVTKVFGFDPDGRSWLYLEELHIDHSDANLHRVISGWDRNVVESITDDNE